MQHEPIEPLLVNKQDAAKLLGIGPTALNKLIQQGELTVVDLGRRTQRIPMEQIKKLISRRTGFEIA